MEESINDIKQLDITLHTGSGSSQAIININESKRSGNLWFIDQIVEIKKIKKFENNYGLQFEAKVNQDWKDATLIMTRAEPETVIVATIDSNARTATIYHETAEFAFYFIRDLKIPVIKSENK
ncbi:hypothetical protein [Pedobacter gandavensis]|uniref:hypothetical protein n=1 Tax=Pedobacter gandavensis TaxID=2679963 RepID=UPI0029312697|nr:hypothetical protein [Pedobacter gandavensis]